MTRCTHGMPLNIGCDDCHIASLADDVEILKRQRDSARHALNFVLQARDHRCPSVTDVEAVCENIRQDPVGFLQLMLWQGSRLQWYMEAGEMAKWRGARRDTIQACAAVAAEHAYGALCPVDGTTEEARRLALEIEQAIRKLDQ